MSLRLDGLSFILLEYKFIRNRGRQHEELLVHFELQNTGFKAHPVG
jgi:hypothetical protein